MLKKNDILTLEVTDMNFLGFGVAKAEGMAVFISGAVTMDIARIRIIKVAKTYAVARTEEIVKPSLLRTDASCPVADSCGGCAFRSIDYSHEKSLKENFVKQSFVKCGLPDVPVAELTNARKLSHYRNKAQYPVRIGKDGNIDIGFFAAKSHRVLNCPDCDLQNEKFFPIVTAISNFIKKYKISVYSEETKSGLIRHIYMRIGEKTGEIMLCLVISGDTLPHSDDFVREIQSAFPAVCSILLNTNKEDTNVILGKKFTLLFGREYITDELCGVKLKITPQSFYQVNRDAAELLYKKAAELAMPVGNETLIDLYCGIGSIGLSMAHRVNRLIGIEVVPSAIECAKENAKLNGMENAAFYCGDAANAEGLLASARASEGDFDLDIVILDPPRKGCDSELIEYLANNNAKKIVYISCNSETLARDAKLFSDRGYSIGTVYPFDLFCRTGHVECVVLMMRQNA